MDEEIVLFYAGREAYEKGNFQKAIEYLEQSSQMDEHYKTYEILYLSWKKLGEPEKAFTCLKRSFALNPHCDKVAVEYAGELASRGETAKAKDILNDTIQRNKTYRPAVRLLEAIS